MGDFELELFRINARGTIGEVMLDAEWRRYNDFDAIHHAWVGYRFNDGLRAELGITQVPFGILPFASHSYWFGGTYYMGFEDDYDTGVKVIQQAGDWTRREDLMLVRHLLLAPLIVLTGWMVMAFFPYLSIRGSALNRSA